MSSDQAMIEVLRSIEGKGPHPYHFVRDEYVAAGGDKSEFGSLLYKMHGDYPRRLIIHRPYNVSRSPLVEVPPRG